MRGESPVVQLRFFLSVSLSQLPLLSSDGRSNSSMGILSSVGVVTPTRHGRSEFEWEWPLALAMRVLSSMGVVTPKGSGHSNSPWAFYLYWEWSLPLAMGVRFRVGVAPPTRYGRSIFSGSDHSQPQ